MRKLTPEKFESLLDDCLDDSTKIIRYLDEKFEQQDKQNQKNMIFTVINTILALVAAIASIAPFFI